MNHETLPEEAQDCEGGEVKAVHVNKISAWCGLGGWDVYLRMIYIPFAKNWGLAIVTRKRKTEKGKTK